MNSKERLLAVLMGKKPVRTAFNKIYNNVLYF